MHCDWKRRHSRLWLANPALWKGSARVLWMAEVLHSRYVGWLKHANILEHSEPSMISGRKNIHKHSTWSKDSLWDCEILFVTLWAVLLLLRKVRHVQIRLLQGYGNAMCLGSEILCRIVVSRVGWSSFFPSQVPISQLWKMWHSSTLCHGCHSFLLVEYFLWSNNKGKTRKKLKNKHIQVQGQDVN